MSISKLISSSIGFLCLSGYLSYHYSKIKSNNIEYSKITNHNEYLHKIHQNNATIINKYLINYEKGSRFPSYRTFLLNNCQGKILEISVGSGLNIPYYPPGSDITAVDWSNKMIELALSRYNNRNDININYKIDDCQNMKFEDNSFDTVVDTFGLHFYHDPKRCLKEIKRVCKKDGKILLLEKGRSYYDAYNLFLEFNKAFYFLNYGCYENFDWKNIIENEGFFIEKEERKINGTIYLYILQNVKNI